MKERPPSDRLSDCLSALLAWVRERCQHRIVNHPYLAGTGVTLADFSVAAPLFYAEKAELPLTPYPHIRDWFARVSSLPAWRPAGHGEEAPRPTFDNDSAHLS
jgi:glutathione S-transferase